MSVTRTAVAFGFTRQTIFNWQRLSHRKDPRLLPRVGTLTELVGELVHRMKREWPLWGTRRIAGQLARLGVTGSRTSVQRNLRRPRPPEPDDRMILATAAGLAAKRPNHIWMIDFTRLQGVVRPVSVGAVIDAFSRKVVAIGFIGGEPDGSCTATLLRRAISRCGTPTWLVSDKDRALRNKRVNALLTGHGIRRRYGAVGRKGSLAIIERRWRSMQQAYARRIFPHRSRSAIEKRLRRWAGWLDAERPHQGLKQRAPNEVYFVRPARLARSPTGGTLHVRFLDGDRRLPVLRHRDAA